MLERNLLLIRGAVPGAEGGQVIVRPSLKAARARTRKTVAPTQGRQRAVQGPREGREEVTP